MALKYQALNGAVISRTATIEGFDPYNTGCPAICSGILSQDKTEVYPLVICAYTSNTNLTELKIGAITQTSWSFSTSTYKASLKPTVTLNGKTFGGTKASMFCYYIGSASSSGSYTPSLNIKGKFTAIVYQVASQDLVIYTAEIDRSYGGSTSSGTQVTFLTVSVPKTENDFVVALQFEPAD